MTEQEEEFSPAILRNKGVPIVLQNVRKTEDNDWIAIYDSEGNPETSTHYVRFTHNVIADIEEKWDGLEQWQESIDSKPVSTMRSTLGILILETAEKTGAMMVEGRLAEYNNAIGVSWALANGVDPTVASQLLQEANKTVDSQINALNSEMEKTLAGVTEIREELDTLGEKQSPPGAKQTKDT